MARPDPIAAQWAGIREVLRSRYFWRYAPFGFAQIGGFMAVQSLWSIAWLMHVNGFTRAEAANHQAAMSLAMLVSYVLIGSLATRLARRGISTLHLMAGGMALSLTTLLLIITQATEHHFFRADRLRRRHAGSCRAPPPASRSHSPDAPTPATT